MVGNQIAKSDRRQSVGWVGEQKQQVRELWPTKQKEESVWGRWKNRSMRMVGNRTANSDRRESLGQVGLQEWEDGGTLDSKLRQKRQCGLGGRIGVGGWWETGQQTQIEERVLGRWAYRSGRMVGHCAANIDRRESFGQVGLGVGGRRNTGQQIQIEEKVLGSMSGRSRRMVGNWTANSDRRGSIVQEGEQEEEDGGKLSERRESVGYVGEQEQEDGGTLDNKLRQKRECWLGGRIGVAGWWDTGQQTPIEEKVLGSMGGRSRRMVGNWTANSDRRE